MADSEVIDEIRKLIAEKDHPLSARTTNRLALAALAELTEKMAQMEKKIDEKMEGTEKKLNKIIPVYKGVLWIGSALGLSVVGLIWAVIIGKAEIVFR